jgi:hypothetical protein
MHNQAARPKVTPAVRMAAKILFISRLLLIAQFFLTPDAARRFAPRHALLYDARNI